MSDSTTFLKAQARELRRPWKLITLCLGIILLVLGSNYFNAMDWDIPISFIMAIFAYLFSATCLRIILERRWQLLPLMLFLTWFTVDGCYWLYWNARNPEALFFMRKANFPASLGLFGLCGVAWLFNGSFHELLSEIRSQLSPGKQKA